MSIQSNVPSSNVPSIDNGIDHGAPCPRCEARDKRIKARVAKLQDAGIKPTWIVYRADPAITDRTEVVGEFYSRAEARETIAKMKAIMSAQTLRVVHDGPGAKHSWAPVFVCDDSGRHYGNAQRFAHYREARESGYARFCVWTMARSHAVLLTRDPANYTVLEGRDVPILDPCPHCDKDRNGMPPEIRAMHPVAC